jgi:HK97 family phage major capsid protein
MSIQQLREQRAAKLDEINALLAKKPWNEARDKPIYDAGIAEIDNLSRRIDAINAMDAKAALATTAASLNDVEHWTTDAGRFPVMRKGSNFKAFYPADSRDEPVTMSDFLRGVAGQKLTPGVRAALSEGTDSAGGYAVPTMLFPQILQALVPVSSLLQAGAGIVDVTQGAGKQFNTAAVDTIPTAAWRSEAGSVSESGPAFRSVPAIPRSLAFFFKVSRELLADAVNLEPALQTAIAQAFAKELDRTGLLGTGTPPEPTGILNTTGVQSVTNGATGASLGTTKYANFISAVQALLAADAPMPTAFIMAPRSLTTLAGLVDGQGQPLRAPPLIENIPFISTSQIPTNLTVSTSTDCSDIFCGAFDRLKFVIRERPSIMLAKELYAGNGQIGFFCNMRVDVAIDYPAAFAKITGVRA